MSTTWESAAASAGGLIRPRTVAAAHGVMQEEGVPVVYLAPLPDGPIVVLKGTASVIWREALDGPEATLPERVARRINEGLTADDIGADISAFIQDLIEQGLLERVPADEETSSGG